MRPTKKGPERQSKKGFRTEKLESYFEQDSAPANVFTSDPSAVAPTLRHWIRRVYWFDNTSPFCLIFLFLRPSVCPPYLSIRYMVFSDHFMLFVSCIAHNHRSLRISINPEIFVSRALVLIIDNFTDACFHIAPERLSSTASTITSHCLIIICCQPIELATERCCLQRQHRGGRGGVMRTFHQTHRAFAPGLLKRC